MAPVTRTPTETPTRRDAVDRDVIQIGVIGVDSSHLPEFTRRINERNGRGETRCRVTEFWTDGKHDMPEAEVNRWKLDTVAHGAKPAPQLDRMLDRVDAAMVLTVNGNRHLAHALPAIKRGLTTYIDKPLTCNLGEAIQLRRAVREHGARCYSASSLRFAPEIEAFDEEKLGKLVTIDAFGPNELNESMPGLFALIRKPAGRSWNCATATVAPPGFDWNARGPTPSAPRCTATGA